MAYRKNFAYLVILEYLLHGCIDPIGSFAMTISEAFVNLHARIDLGKVFRIEIIQKIIGVDLGRLERELLPIKILVGGLE